MDLLLQSVTGDLIHLEMQRSLHPNFKERIQRYNAREAGRQQKSGQGYGVTKRAISLVIVSEELFDDSDNYHEKINMRRENGKIFTKIQELNIIDITKVNNANTKEKYNWGKLFEVSTLEELVMLVNESERMKSAAEKLIQISEDDIAQAYASSYENALLKQQMIDADNARKAKETEQQAEKVKQEMEEAEQKIEEAEQQVEKAKREIAKKLFAKGMDLEDISELTNFPVLVIKKLRKELSTYKSHNVEVIYI